MAHQLLKLATPEYPNDILELASGSPSPQSSEYFDVVSLLSSVGGRDLVRNNGDRLVLNTNTFKGKYVLVCCFHVPVAGRTWTHHQVVNLCNELYATRDDFEMVMVARMNGLANDRDVFNHFFSGFPELCLVVPFEDNQRRDYICKVLDLGLDLHSDYNYYQFLFLNIEGKVLPSLTKYYGLLLDHYGAKAFPFTDDIKYKSNVECREVVFGNVSFDRILRCNESSPDFVYKINHCREKVFVSQLSNEFNNKHVGLYLCSKGNILLDLLHMYEQCKRKQLEFEIVVVYQPFVEAIDPKIFQEKIDGLLKRHNVRGWWCLPVNNSISRRFWRLTTRYDTERGEGMSFDNGDKLIVVGPRVEHLDMYGAYVMQQHGIDVFPFTIEANIQLRMKELREITLESLFVNGDVLFMRGNDRNDVISVKELQGKKIFLFIDKLLVVSSETGSQDYGRKAYLYTEHKSLMEEGHSFEMVFVDVKHSTHPVLEDKERNKIMSKMPWFVCPINGTESTNLDELLRLFLNKDYCYDTCIFFDALVEFGEDGRICSVQDFKNEYGGVNLEFSSRDALHEDVEQILGYDGFGDHCMKMFANPQEPI